MISGSTKLKNARDNDIYLVSEYNGQDIRQFANYDAVVLSLNNPAGAVNMLRNIRSSFIESVYMLPVFFLKTGDEDITEDPDYSLSDGVLKVIEEENISPFVDMIKKRRNEFSSYEQFNPERRVLTKLLRYLYSRNINLKPVVNVNSQLGYEYPLISSHFPKNHIAGMLKLLNWSVENKYLDKTFSDRLHLCPDCHSGHLNYREVCPKCKSADIESDNLIHHFVCAYAGPESDFVRNDRMICPKCNRRLRHIGVDYDRPSIIYKCNDCRNEFQNSDMTVLCFSCKKNFQVSDLIEMDVNEYSLTEKGREAARKGVGSEEKEFSVPGVINFSTFSVLLKFEIERIKSTGRTGVLMNFKLKFPSDIQTNRESCTRLLADIARFIRGNISSGDIMTYTSDNSFFVLFPEKKAADIKLLQDTIKNSIFKLLKGAIDKKNSWRVDTGLEELSEKADSDALVKRIRKRRNYN